MTSCLNKAMARKEMHLSLALQVPLPGCPKPWQSCRHEVQGTNHQLRSAPVPRQPGRSQSWTRSPGAEGREQRVGRTAPAQPPALGSRTPASGRASLATQSQGSAASFLSSRAGPADARPGTETRDGLEEPGAPLTADPGSGDRPVPARLPASTCARRAPPGNPEPEETLALPSSHRCRRPSRGPSRPQPLPAASR